MDPSAPHRRDLRRWLVLLAALPLALAWLKPLDRAAEAHIEAGLKRALATYAVARTINGVISVVQETGVSVQPGGVGVTFAPGQFLDPLNDFVEQVSSVMLAVCVSFGVQLLLVHIGGSALVSAVLTAATLAWAWARWTRQPVPRWGSRLLVAMLLVRFAVPIAASAAELTYDVAMAKEYGAAQGQLESTAGKVSQADSPTEATRPPGIWDLLKTIPKWGDAKAEDQQVRSKMEQIKARLDGIVEHILRIVAIFVVQTVLLPLLFMALLGKLLGALLVSRHS